MHIFGLEGQINYLLLTVLITIFRKARINSQNGMIEGTGCCEFIHHTVSCMLVRNIFHIFKGCINCMCLHQNLL